MSFANAAKRTRPTVPLAQVAQLTATHFAENNAGLYNLNYWGVSECIERLLAPFV